MALVESRFDDTDNSFLLAQYSFLEGGPDPVLRFGPLTSNLSAMYADGWHLTAWGFRTCSRTFPLRLRRGLEVWKVGRVIIDQALKSDNLAQWVDMTKPRADQTICRLPLFAFVDTDPFKAVMQKYPPTRKTAHMIGNKTLREFALEHLRDKN